VSPAAEDLIRSLLTDPENRLNFDAIRAHPFFADVDFDNIHQSEQLICILFATFLSIYVEFQVY
jgi:hypothetical protein